MKEIEIIFQHKRLPAINELLYKHKVGFLFYKIDGRARETRDEVPEIISKEAPYATGRKYIPNFISAIKLEAIVSDSMAKPIVDEIMATLSTGSASDGRIFVKDIPEGYDIGSKKSWDAAFWIEAELKNYVITEYVFDTIDAYLGLVNCQGLEVRDNPSNKKRSVFCEYSSSQYIQTSMILVYEFCFRVFT